MLRSQLLRHFGDISIQDRDRGIRGYVHVRQATCSRLIIRSECLSPSPVNIPAEHTFSRRSYIRASPWQHQIGCVYLRTLHKMIDVMMALNGRTISRDALQILKQV